MPAASHVEKEGSFTNTQRLVQWRDKALDPPGDARSRPVVHLPPGQARPGALRGQRPTRATGRSRTSRWDYGEDEPDAELVLKEINGYDDRHRQARQRLRRAQGRRLDRVRLLDLLRRLRRRRQPGAAPRPRRHRRSRGRLGLARVGLGLAGQPPHPLQPRLRRPGGQAVVGAQEVRLVGRGREAVDRLRRAGLPGRQGRRLPRPARRRGHGRDRRRRPVHHDGRRPRLAVRAERPARRPAADALRAARVAARRTRSIPTATPTRRR